MSSERRSTPKSIRTREAIEAAAKILFANKGFEQSTVREIGGLADVDPSLIIRYFGSKEALFARVARPFLALPDLGSVPKRRIGEVLVGHFLDQWEGGHGGLPVLLRSAASNEEAAQRLRDIFRDQVFPTIAGAGDPATAPQRAALVASQLLGLALTRYLLKLPPMAAMPRATIVKTIGATVQGYATGKALS